MIAIHRLKSTAEKFQSTMKKMIGRYSFRSLISRQQQTRYKYKPLNVVQYVQTKHREFS